MPDFNERIKDAEKRNAEYLQSIAKSMSRHNNPAEWMRERLVKYINAFEKDLDENQEIGGRLVSFGSEIKFHISDIGFHGPDLITFHGYLDSGEAVQLIQNISQISILLIALPKQNDKARRIGFRMSADQTED